MDDGMFPGVGKFTGCETGVDKIEKDVTDGIETEPENLDADTVSRRIWMLVSHAIITNPRLTGVSADRGGGGV